MVELVRHDGVIGTQKGAENSAVGIKTRRKQDGVIHAEKLSDLALQRTVLILSTADETHR